MKHHHEQVVSAEASEGISEVERRFYLRDIFSIIGQIEHKIEKICVNSRQHVASVHDSGAGNSKQIGRHRMQRVPTGGSRLCRRRATYLDPKDGRAQAHENGR